jgi:dihydroflavonol-4-reductase
MLTLVNLDSKILVLGASGFIGKAVIRRLLDTYQNIHCFIRTTSKKPAFFKSEKVTAHYGDILDKESLQKAMQEALVVINCTGKNSFWEKEKEIYRQINVLGTKNIMSVAIEAKVEKVVHVSTVMAYGFPEKQPFTEATPPGKHTSQYAYTKYLGDEIAMGFHAVHNLPVVIVYLAAVIGKGETKDVMKIQKFLDGKIPVLIRSDNQFTYVAIDDAAEAIVRAAEKSGNAGERYLIGDQRLTIEDYFSLLSKISGKPLPKMTLGKATTLTLARLMNCWSRITGKEPLMALELMKTQFYDSLLFDPSKGMKELGMEYQPIRFAFEEAVAEREINKEKN